MDFTQSERVIVRAFLQGDWADIHALAADWSQAPGPAFDKWPTSEEGTKSLLNMFINQGNQFYAVHSRSSNQVIGLISLTSQNERQCEIGHVMLSKYQDNDVDREALGSVVDHVFLKTAAQTIISHNAPEHLEQVQPLKTLGFTTANAEDEGEYILTRADWEVRNK